MGSRIPSATYPNASFTFGNEITAVQPGQVVALRFYRLGSSTLLTRALKLWTTAGVLLGSVQTTETAGLAGWIEVALPTPVALSGGQAVVVSYDSVAADSYPFDSATLPSDTANLVLSGSHYGTPGGYPSNFRVGTEFADMKFIPPGEVWPIALRGDSAPVVVLTQAEYDALSTKDPATVYVVT
jgi:hypothetical protein